MLLDPASPLLKSSLPYLPSSPSSSRLLSILLTVLKQVGINTFLPSSLSSSSLLSTHTCPLQCLQVSGVNIFLGPPHCPQAIWCQYILVHLTVLKVSTMWHPCNPHYHPVSTTWRPTHTCILPCSQVSTALASSIYLHSSLSLIKHHVALQWSCLCYCQLFALTMRYM